MQRFKKRVRILAERRNSSVEFGHDDSLLVRACSGSATFTPRSYLLMTCSIDLGNAPRKFPLPKEYVFDIVDRLGTSHLASTLLDYPKPRILTLHDYINEEHGLPILKTLQKELKDNPALVHKDLGGNRILAQYFRGVLILCDDLVMDATNVIEFSASSPVIEYAT